MPMVPSPSLAFTIDARIRLREQPFGVGAPDPDVEAIHAELILALEFGSEKCRRRAHWPQWVGNRQLYTDQLRSVIPARLVEQSVRRAWVRDSVQQAVDVDVEHPSRPF